MKFKVEELKSVQPYLCAGSTQLKIEAVLNQRQLDDLFSLVWEQLGDDWLKHRLNSEAYRLCKKPTPSSKKGGEA